MTTSRPDRGDSRRSDTFFAAVLSLYLCVVFATLPGSARNPAPATPPPPIA